jgi:putative transposase
LKLMFLVVTRAVSVLGLSRREAWWKDAEILMLRHQLAVALRERPRAHSRLTWPDRAWLTLLAGTLPAGRLGGLQLIVTRPRLCAGTATSSAAAGRGCPAGTFRTAPDAP